MATPTRPMTMARIKAFRFPKENPGRNDIADLHAAMKKLRLKIDPEEIRKGEVGKTTTAAVKKFQKQAGLRTDGKLNAETVETLRTALTHAHFAASKTRTQKIHAMLERLGHRIAPEEADTRIFGKTTEKALKAFQKKAGLPQDGRMDDALMVRLDREALNSRLSVKTQVGMVQRKLLRAIRIAKLEVRIDAGELKQKKLGESSKAAVKAFQKKYGLNATGEIDPATYERMVSVAAGRPVLQKKLKVKSAVNLLPVRRVLRLNMTNKDVGEAQKALSFLGYSIHEKEYKAKNFGKSTREAVIAFQKAGRLPVTGHVDTQTRKALNAAIQQANPAAFALEHPFRIKGAIRDDLWKGRAGVKIQIWEKTLRGKGTQLAEGKTLANGFFDLPYDPPRNAVDGQVKIPFHLLVKVVDTGGRELLPGKVLFNPTLIAWINFTQGEAPYRGTSEYEHRMKAVSKVLDTVSIAEIKETDENQEITHTAINSGLSPDDVMRLALSHRAAESLNHPKITPEVFYAFIRQNLPPNLPGDLLGSTESWELIDQLVETACNGLVFMETDPQTQGFENAVNENLIPITVAHKKEEILTALASRKQAFALEKPILIGNGNLKTLLNASTITAAHYNKIADAFLTHKDLGPAFWSDVASRAAEFGGDNAVKDFRTTVHLGQVTKHHGATLNFLKTKLADPNAPELNKPGDLAKLSHGQWEALINENGGVVPDGIDGDTPAEKIAVFAATLAAQSERLFPGIAFAAEVGRSSAHQLTKVTEIQQLLDAHEDLDLRTANLDSFVKEKAINVADDVMGEVRVLQRVHRIAPTAAHGRALLEEKIHHSAAIISLGKERLVGLLKNRGVDERAALTIYGFAEFKYAQVLARLGEYRFELHRANPRAIVNYTYTQEEQQTLLEGIPNLKTLFGSQDFCDCDHCRSVYGPAAYLADLLRFLESHPSEKAGKRVADILFFGGTGPNHPPTGRRPDIGNIKLNCDNTNTPLPYIDLVCEILENAMPAPGPNADFKFQTTRTKEELRAFPENVRKSAYDKLKSADYPMDASLNLWQEEARIFLQHLGVNRSELMARFQGNPGGGAPVPADLSIAGEYWGISSHETALIVTPKAATPDQDNFWGLDTTRTRIKVSEFLAHAKISYTELLDLLYIKWLQPPAAADRLRIERPVDSCQTETQHLVKLTTALFDQIHRFLRLWRRTGWEMWELNLLLRAAKVGNGNLDAQTLVRLHHFKKVQETLGLDFETALSLFHQINTETRVKPDEPQKQFHPLYITLFQNPAVTNPVNARFALPLAGGDKLSDHKATLQAALSVTAADLDLLLAQTNDALTLANLTLIHNQVNLANGMKITVKDLLTLETLANVADPFVSPKQTLDFIETNGWVKTSGFTVQELDYLLNHRPESPHGMRVAVITQYIQALRESLRTVSGDKTGPITSQVATTFSLTDEQTQALLAVLNHQGPVLDHLKDEKLTEKDADDQYTTEITPANFPKIYNAYRLLHKTAMVVKTQKITAGADLKWLLANATAFNALDLNTLPIGAAPVQPLFQPWLNLHKWLDFKSRYPEPEETSLRRIFDLALTPASKITDVLADLALLTQWKIEDLNALECGRHLPAGATPAECATHLQQPVSAEYKAIDTYLRLDRCFQQIKRIGADAAMLLTWADRDNDAGGAQFTTAKQIIQAAKSKHGAAIWLEKVRPFQDELREKKRDALIKYLVEHSLRTQSPTIVFGGKTYANPKYWKNAAALLSYFLIDVEMSACQLTSRIKQAVSSVQMFVQRCFLNLEKPYVEVSQEEREDKVSLNSWRQWKWMKNYRIWEANRKVFLYPENWIEPELRDDKSPFFKELESEILQAEITHDNVEAAFLSYLQKVHEVSRLEIAGIYHEVDDDNPYDNLPPNINVLHVVGRTRSQPAAYFYRQFDLSYGTWTGWERIELDITGDHVIPVIYNRKLHLFWLLFEEKAQKIKKQPPAKAGEAPTDSPDPPKQLEVQLAWSVRKETGWTSRKVSPQKLIHPWERPRHSYNLKPRYKRRENLLWLDIYISTSLHFNNTRFYDPYKNNRDYLTAFRYDETARPWHSSSFIFDGEVVDVKLKALAGQYHVLDSSGIASDNLVSTTSYQYVHDSFGEHGETLKRMNGKYEIAPRLMLPDGMHYHNTHLANNRRTLNAGRLNILEFGATKTLLTGANSPFELVFSQHNIRFDAATWGETPFFYQDNARTFFIKPEWQEIILGYNKTIQQRKYVFYPAYHPYTALFIRELNRSGMEGLLNRKIQRFPHSYYPGNTFRFNTDYAPKSPHAPDETAQKDIVDFKLYGAYALYNWEIFFHAPLMIACKLNQNQRFEEAMQWFHYIFDPTNTEALGTPRKYWITRPFFEQNADDYRKQRIEKLLENIDDNLDQLRAWKNNPFKPHLIAHYRPVAYQKTVVMKYIDNLIDWGDQLFRRDTMESINEATLLYVLAYELLGPRPVKVPNVEHEDYTYNELTADSALDPFGNKKVDVLMENFTGTPVRIIRSRDGSEPLPRLEVFYFCIPNNDQLLKYWETVEDRLFKIRHCMNIQGVVRQLPLFEPPIDPALLVKAAAAGVDLSSVLSDAAAPQGQYRFTTLAQQALAFCNEVKALGDKVLSALEKKDAEGLALLRSANEIKMLEVVKSVRKEQQKEAKLQWEGLEKGVDVLDKKIDYYGGIPYMNAWETAGVTFHILGIASEIVATILNTVAGTAHLIPQITAGAAGFGGSPTLVVEIGGENVGRSSTNWAALFQGLAGIFHQGGQALETQGGYQRRDEENTFQKELAEKEKTQLEKQIAAARIRYLIAEKEVENHDLQIEHSKSVDTYMRSKYTHQQLYDWMLKQLSTTYFQAYQLAYDMAKRAQKSFQFELGNPNAAFIQFGYWDSLKKGLLAGERLANDIRRMEMAYYDENKRGFELTKHISLAQYMPMDLLGLISTGACTVTLPEWLFDMDYPGHYRRRIKSISVTIPAVTGPYTGVNCTLSLTQNGVRLTDDTTGGYGDPLTTNDTRFSRDPVPIQSIATSHGQNDSGLFELSFNDERYLPFEGAGAVSEWRIDLPKESNQFDFATISDIILHVRYTATAGSAALTTAAKNNLDAVLPTSGFRLMDLTHEFSNEWHRFLNPAGGGDQELTLNLGTGHLPFYAVRAKAEGKNIRLTRIDLIVESTHTGDFDLKLQLPGMAAPVAEPDAMTTDPTFGNMHHWSKDNVPPNNIPVNTNLPGQWKLLMKKDSDTDFKQLAAGDVRGVYLVVRFSVV